MMSRTSGRCQGSPMKLFRRLLRSGRLARLRRDTGPGLGRWRAATLIQRSAVLASARLRERPVPVRESAPTPDARGDSMWSGGSGYGVFPRLFAVFSYRETYFLNDIESLFL